MRLQIQHNLGLGRGAGGGDEQRARLWFLFQYGENVGELLPAGHAGDVGGVGRPAKAAQNPVQPCLGSCAQGGKKNSGVAQVVGY